MRRKERVAHRTEIKDVGRDMVLVKKRRGKSTFRRSRCRWKNNIKI